MKKKENKRAKSQEQSAKGKEQRAENAKMHECENARMQECGTTDNNSTVSQSDNLTNGISTVFKIKKPSAIEFYVPAEGCISGSRAVRACLMIRVFNN